jgi:uncharacterized membrane protein
MVSYSLANSHMPVLAAQTRLMLAIGVLAYLLDGVGWIMYFQSTIAGPITIVGTLSAAYPAITIVLARISIVTPLTGAYPVVTLAFAALVLRERIALLQWGCIAAILVGMFFCTA